MDAYLLTSNILDSTPGHETGEAVMYILNDGRYIPIVKFDQNGVSINRYDNWLPIPFENVMIADIPIAVPLPTPTPKPKLGESNVTDDVPTNVPTNASDGGVSP